MSSSNSRINHLQRRLQSITTITESLKIIDQRFFWYRLAAFLGAWVLAILTRFIFPGIAWIWVLVGMFIIFLVVVYFHRRLDVQRQKYQDAEGWLSEQLARARLDWKNIPAMKEFPAEPDHPFMNDLNLVGEKSLLQLIDSCISKGGQRLLHTWFLQPDLDHKIITTRQKLVKELIDLPGFRYRFMLLGWQTKRINKGLWSDEGIQHWLKHSNLEKSIKVILLILLCLTGLNYVLVAMNLLAGWPAFWQFSLILYLGFYFFQYRSYQSTFQEAYQINKDLKPLENNLLFLEQYPSSPGSQLSILLSPIKKIGQRPSEFLRKIVWISSAASLQNNQILSLLINILMPWDMFFAYVLDRYKQKLSHMLPTWLEVWYSADGHLALANFAYLNPEYHFPVIQETYSESLFDAKGIGHPLIAKEVKIVNDYSFNHLGQVALISGSNMSGKSTFLRTLGINSCLAYAGSVVNATQFHLSIFRLFTCIQVSDSLKDGYSYFYAEVRRLKELLRLLDKKEQVAVLYLIDEIFQGTNHEERRIGSLAYIRALLKSNGLGTISTHDIELSKLADKETNLVNYNFQDSVVDGKMNFDYRLRSGPSPTTNALKIMALEGLPVDIM